MGIGEGVLRREKVLVELHLGKEGSHESQHTDTGIEPVETELFGHLPFLWSL